MKQVEVRNKRVLTCLECRVKKNHSALLSYHVQTRHPEKSTYLLAKECSKCNLIFSSRVFYQRHCLAVHDKRTDEEVFD